MTGQQRLPRGGTIAVLVVAVGLLGVWLVGPPAGTGAALSNRPIAEFPTITPAGLLDTDTYVQAEAALTDRVRFKPWAVAGVNSGVVAVTGRSPSGQVVANGDQWFYAGEFTEPCPYLAATEAAATGMRNLTDAATAGGKKVLFVVVPNKSTTLGDQIPRPQQSLQDCSLANRAALTALADLPQSNVSLVSPQRVLSLAGDNAYWPQDTHWTTDGGRALTEHLAERLGDADAVARHMQGIRVSGTDAHVPDLRPLLGLSGTWDTPRWDPVTAPQFTELPDLAPWPPRTFVSADPMPGAPSATLIYDSFVYAPRLEAQVASLFPTGNLVQWDAVAALPQLPVTQWVVLESTERLALGRLAGMQTGGPYQPLLDYLAAETT